MNASEMKRLTKMKTENEGNDKEGGREKGTYWQMGVESGWREGGEVFCGV